MTGVQTCALPISRWSFFIRGSVDQPITLNWAEFKALPRVEDTSDFHCVTRWSRFDNDWKGISTRTLLELAHPSPQTKHVLVHGEQGYTANIPMVDFTADHVLFATHHDGQPLTEEHGGPLRLIVPHLYAWKSVKWVRGIELLDHDTPGFWEQNGYHNYGDPFREQRFSE